MSRLTWAAGIAAGTAGALVAAYTATGPSADRRGVWETEGYGLLLDVGWFTADLYETAGDHCVKAETLPAHPLLMRYATGVSVVPAANRTLLDVDGTLDDISVTRLPALPSACLNSAAPDAATQFDLFWESFDTHYPFFALHDVDWDARRSLRPAVDADNAALAEALTAALAGFNDDHVTLNLPSGEVTTAYLPDWADQIDEFWAVTDGLVDKIDKDYSTGLGHGWLPGNIGYIRIGWMGPEKQPWQSYPEASAKAFAPLVEMFRDAKGLIVDIRWNSGGYDEVGYAYAGFFTDAPVPVGDKRTQIAQGSFTDPTPLIIAPQPGALDLPVVLLTSPVTVSAGETFAMAMAEMPNVTLMGKPTSGAISDMIERHLPNGWTFTLPHQIYTDAAGGEPEGTGILPDIAHPVDAEAFSQGRDTALEAARALLSSQ